MPQGTIKSAHYLQTPHYTQVTGTGDFTKINIQAGDDGGELDPHGGASSFRSTSFAPRGRKA
mgnify:CR=1 FL=1